MKSCVKDWLNDEYSEDSPERMVSEFYDFNDEIPTPTDAQQKREIRHLTSVIRKIAKEMDENGEWKRYMWSPHILNDLQMRDIIHGEWDAESFSAEEPSVYYWVKTEMENLHPMTEPDLEQLLEMLSVNVPVPVLENGMEQAEDLRDEPTYIMLHLAHEKAKFIEKFQADYPTVRPNCKCGATLEWDNLRKAWYCISCPFNTYKAEENLCDCGEKTEITCEICSKEHGDLCKICYDEHIVDCPHCEGDGGIPRSWVSDSGDRWNPPSLDVTSFDTCEYCEGEGKICESDYDNIPQFSWDAESFSADGKSKSGECYSCGEKGIHALSKKLTEDGNCPNCGALQEICDECGITGNPDVGWEGHGGIEIGVFVEAYDNEGKRISPKDAPEVGEGSFCIPCVEKWRKMGVRFEYDEWGAESFSAESNGDLQLDESKKSLYQQAIDTIEARVADYTTHEDVNPYWGGGMANPK